LTDFTLGRAFVPQGHRSAPPPFPHHARSVTSLMILFHQVFSLFFSWSAIKYQCLFFLPPPPASRGFLSPCVLPRFFCPLIWILLPAGRVPFSLFCRRSMFFFPPSFIHTFPCPFCCLDRVGCLQALVSLFSVWFTVSLSCFRVFGWTSSFFLFSKMPCSR